MRPTWRSALVVAFIANALYTFHLLPYMLFLVLGGLLCLTQRRAWNPILLAARGLPVVSGVALGIWAYRHEKKLGFLSITGKREFVFRSFEDTLHLVPGRLMNMLSSTRDEWVLVALVGGWLLLAVAAARGRKPGLEEGSVARALALPICFAVTFAAVLLMPQTMHRPFYWYMINLRFVPLAALFAALLLRGSFDGWRRWLFAPVAAASLFYAVDLARGVWMFNQRVDGFDAVVEQIPRRARVLTLSLRPLVDPDFNVGVYNQWPAYVQLRRGGYNFYNFAQGFPLKYKTLLPAPPWDHAELFNYDSQGYAWEYFLVHHEGREADPLKNARDAHQIELVAARGDWKLYKNLHPRF